MRTCNVVPPIVVLMTKDPMVQKYDLSSLHYVGSGAAPLGKDLCEELQQKLPTIQHVVQGWITTGGFEFVVAQKGIHYTVVYNLANGELIVFTRDSAVVSF